MRSAWLARQRLRDSCIISENIRFAGAEIVAAHFTLTLEFRYQQIFADIYDFIEVTQRRSRPLQNQIAWMETIRLLLRGGNRSSPEPRLASDRHFCGVEVWRGGLGGAYRLPTLSSVGASLVRHASVSTPRSSNRTCGFAASGSRRRLTQSP